MLAAKQIRFSTTVAAVIGLLLDSMVKKLHGPFCNTDIVTLYFIIRMFFPNNFLIINLKDWKMPFGANSSTVKQTVQHGLFWEIITKWKIKC